MDTLVLDSSYQPMRKVTWRRAMELWVGGKVQILSEYSDRFVHTSQNVFNVPSVVRFVSDVRRRWKNKGPIKFTKPNVYNRDDGKCQYCRASLTISEATYDHVIPKSSGGKRSWTNIVIACFGCNQKKRNRTPDRANMKLIQVPIRPKSLKTRSGFAAEDVPADWKAWLGITD